MAIFNTASYGAMPAYSNPNEEALRQRIGQFPQQANLANQWVSQFQAAAPQGIQSQTPGLASGAAQQLMQGQSLEERIAARNALRNRFNSALGRVAGSGATGSSFLNRSRSEALPELIQGEQQMAGEEARRRQEGAGQVFGGLSSSLLGPDPLAEAFGREIAGLQQPFSGVYMGGPGLFRGHRSY